jgi:F0F1-type ATP synthase assembly protein I
LNDDKKTTDYVEYISLGGEIAAGIVVPIFIGYWLDGWLETSPWLLLVGCVVGIVNIFILIFQLNDRLNKK